MNPAAIMREPIDVEDHQNSRWVCEPLHLLDYCLINDGAACVIVTTSERARNLKKPPVYISGIQGLPGGREEFIWARPGLGVLQQSVFEYEAGLQPVVVHCGVPDYGQYCGPKSGSLLGLLARGVRAEASLASRP